MDCVKDGFVLWINGLESPNSKLQQGHLLKKPFNFRCFQNFTNRNDTFFVFVLILLVFDFEMKRGLVQQPLARLFIPCWV